MKTYQARLLTESPMASAFPPSKLPEVAVVGRSNTGKSTLINTLTGMSIARVSKQPGRTRSIFFYDIEDRFLLVDLPGYGYAKGPREDPIRWRKLVGDYLFSGRSIVSVIALFDIRREPDDLDFALLHMLREANVPCTVVWTKSDKFPPSRVKQRGVLLDGLLGIQEPGLLFSKTSLMGREELLERVERCVSTASCS
jgi:GTP-binding protein